MAAIPSQLPISPSLVRLIGEPLGVTAVILLVQKIFKRARLKNLASLENQTSAKEFKSRLQHRSTLFSRFLLAEFAVFMFCFYRFLRQSNAWYAFPGIIALTHCCVISYRFIQEGHYVLGDFYYKSYAHDKYTTMDGTTSCPS
jgi:hypothetical protein